MKIHEKFNNSAFGGWINGRSGRLFRLGAGLVFLTMGLYFSQYDWHRAFLIWSLFPLSAGIFDFCWISLVLGGPLSGSKILEKRNQVKS